LGEEPIASKKNKVRLLQASAQILYFYHFVQNCAHASEIGLKVHRCKSEENMGKIRLIVQLFNDKSSQEVW